MEELKLECLVEGYEGTYFEVGQVWETKSGYKLKIKSFNLKADVYKIIMISDDLIGNYYYTSEGKKIQGFESELDLVKLISTESTQPEFISTEEFNQMLEQKSSTKYMVFVEGKNTPRYIHETKASAETEAKRLSAKEIGCNVFVVNVVKTFKSKVIVGEI